MSQLLQEVVGELQKLPGIGRRTALRLAMHLLKMEPESVDDMTTAIDRFRHEIQHCSRCNNLSDDAVCRRIQVGLSRSEMQEEQGSSNRGYQSPHLQCMQSHQFRIWRMPYGTLFHRLQISESDCYKFCCFLFLHIPHTDTSSHLLRLLPLQRGTHHTHSTSCYDPHELCDSNHRHCD